MPTDKQLTELAEIIINNQLKGYKPFEYGKDRPKLQQGFPVYTKDK